MLNISTTALVMVVMIAQNRTGGGVAPPARGHMGSCLLHGLVCTAARAEAVARFGKVRVEDRLHGLMDRLLDESIYYRGDAQLSHPCAPRLGNFYKSYGTRFVPACQQALFDAWPVPA